MKTVKVSEETHRRLEAMCSKNTSFNDIITFLVDQHEKTVYYDTDTGELKKVAAIPKIQPDHKEINIDG